MRTSTLLLTVGILGLVAGDNIRAQSASVTQQGPVTVFAVPNAASTGTTIDYVNAKPMPLPSVSPGQVQADLLQSLLAGGTAGSAGFVAGVGGPGNGQATAPAQFLGAPAGASADSEGLGPQEFGTFNHPFS